MSFLSRFKKNSSYDKDLLVFIVNIFGFKPRNISIYKLAFLHKSAASEIVKGIKISNERLEFLGDAILSAVIADYLYKKFPFKDEGFLTEMRSKLVSRSRLNKLSQKLGMMNHVQTNSEIDLYNKAVYGNTFEAFVGALYIDQGYDFSRKIIIENIFNVHFDIDEIQLEDLNFKSKLLEWAQSAKLSIEYKVINESTSGNGKLYTVHLFVDNNLSGTGKDYSIKKAEQNAAENFLKNKEKTEVKPISESDQTLSQ